MATESHGTSHWSLPIIPASFFGMVLGLLGLANDWRVAHRVWHLPFTIGEVLVAIGCMVWALWLALYVLKWIFARQEAIDEASHPVSCCFIGLIGVATMVVAAGVLPYQRAAAEILYAFGAAYTLGFAVWRTGGLWLGERNHADTTPVLYLPTVAGCFVMAAVGGTLGIPDWGRLAFGAGLFSWFALESVFIHRLLTEASLPVALRPTLGIQLAPAPVGAVAFLGVAPESPSIVVYALMGYGLLQTLILLRLLPWIYRPTLAPGYWAFTFGVTALVLASLRLVELGDAGALAKLAPYLFVAANGLVAVIAAGTVIAAFRGTLIPKMMRLAYKRVSPVAVAERL